MTSPFKNGSIAEWATVQILMVNVANIIRKTIPEQLSLLDKADVIFTPLGYLVIVSLFEKYFAAKIMLDPVC